MKFGITSLKLIDETCGVVVGVVVGGGFTTASGCSAELIKPPVTP